MLSSCSEFYFVLVGSPELRRSSKSNDFQRVQSSSSEFRLVFNSEFPTREHFIDLQLVLICVSELFRAVVSSSDFQQALLSAPISSSKLSWLRHCWQVLIMMNSKQSSFVFKHLCSSVLVQLCRLTFNLAPACCPPAAASTLRAHRLWNASVKHKMFRKNANATERSAVQLLLFLAEKSEAFGSMVNCNLEYFCSGFFLPSFTVPFPYEAQLRGAGKSYYRYWGQRLGGLLHHLKWGIEQWSMEPTQILHLAFSSMSCQ